MDHYRPELSAGCHLLLAGQTDTEATNCSGTMSTENEDEQVELESGAQSGRLTMAIQQQHYDSDQATTATLSLASQTQAPPSYLSAAKCANELDPGQLVQLTTAGSGKQSGYAQPSGINACSYLGGKQIVIATASSMMSTLPAARLEPSHFQRPTSLSGRDFRPTNEQVVSLNKLQQEQQQRQYLQMKAQSIDQADKYPRLTSASSVRQIELQNKHKLETTGSKLPPQNASAGANEIDGFWQEGEQRQRKLLVEVQLAATSSTKPKEMQKVSSFDPRTCNPNGFASSSRCNTIGTGRQSTFGPSQSGELTSTQAAEASKLQTQTTSHRSTCSLQAASSQQRKRRARHRHTSGSRESGSSGEEHDGEKPEQVEGQVKEEQMMGLEQQHQQEARQSGEHNGRAISAHCWLIDSSDDQSTACRETNGNAEMLGSHYAVAGSVGAGGSGHDFPVMFARASLLNQTSRSAHSAASWAELGVKHTQQAAISHVPRTFCENRFLPPATNQNNPDTTTNTLRTSSTKTKSRSSRVKPLGLVQTLQRQSGNPKRISSSFSTRNLAVSDYEPPYCTTAFTLRAKQQRMVPLTNTTSCYSIRSAPLQRHSKLTMTKQPTDTGRKRASSLVRVSALFSLVGNLFSGNSSSASKQRATLYAAGSSGGSSLPSNQSQPYTLGASSSSSTSAYATGNSSRLSQRSTSLASRKHGNQQQQQDFKQTQANGGSRYSWASLPASRVQASGPPSSVPHSYAYCDNFSHLGDQLEQPPPPPPELDLDDRFELVDLNGDDGGRRCQTSIKATGRNKNCNPETSSGASSTSDTERTVTATETSDSDTRFGFAKPTSSRKHSEHQVGLSDHELISAISDLQQPPEVSCSRNLNQIRDPQSRAYGCSSLSRATRSRMAAASRRRGWWWRSIFWQSGRNFRPTNCFNSGAQSSMDDFGGQAGDFANSKSRQHPINRGKAANYRSLNRSAQSSDDNMEKRSPATSTLDNVISLAKADRSFRTRLLASIVISCILCILLGLLGSQFYRKSSKFLFKGDEGDDFGFYTSLPATSSQQHSKLRNRLNFLIDESDQDLSWLWPQRQQNPGEQDGQSQQRLFQNQRQAPLDGKLALILSKVESSKLLDHFHSTMLHLINIQLANDNFVDLTRLSKYLAQVPDLNLEDEQADLEMQSSFETNATQTVAAQRLLNRSIQLNQADQDLVGLILLSNVYWPLVKWRHQNQRSMAGFLSFALPSMLSPSSSPVSQGEQISLSSSGELSLKKLLSVFLLCELLPIVDQQQQTDNLMAQHQASSLSGGNVMQFQRLNQQLKQSSYHLISCSHLLAQLKLASEESRQQYSRRFKYKFCKLLIHRYKLMMSILSQADHSKLHKLQLQNEELFTAKRDSLPASGVSGKSLMSFFLDRLQLLDVELLSETILAQNSQLAEQIDANYYQDLSQPGSESLIQDLLSKDSFLSAFKTNWNFQDSTQAGEILLARLEPQNSVFELSKQVIGKSASQLNIEIQQETLNWTSSSRVDRLLSKNFLFPWNSHHLPLFMKPISYDLFLHPNMTTGLFVGMVKLEFQLERETSFIVINSKNLNLIELSLWLKQAPMHLQQQSHQLNGSSDTSSLKQVPIRRVIVNKKLEQIHVELWQPMQATTILGFAEQIQESELNFGELGPQMGGNSHERKVHRFVLIISFNKTNLMPTEAKDVLKRNLDSGSEGLRFISYGDSFAQQPENEIKLILHSQFEPTNARKVFPCLDEPIFKAKFQLNLVHEQHQSSLFNAPKRERVPYSADGRLQMSVFEPTKVPICTYLVAFVIYDSQNIRSLTSRAYSGANQSLQTAMQNGGLQQAPIQVQVFSQYELLTQAEFASQLVPKLLNFYQSYLDFAFPMEKLDLFAIPKVSQPQVEQVEQTDWIQSIDQSKQLGGERAVTGLRANTGSTMDTMENFGLIWFKSNLLLIDTNLISQDSLEQTALIVSHQIGHQFFGNIVSLRNWQDFWLYEALCQYLEALALSQVERDWKLEEQAPISTIDEQLALELYQPLPSKAEASGASNQQSADWSLPGGESGASSSSKSDSTGEDLPSSWISRSRQQLSNPFQPIGLRESSATLHMLLLNLLSSFEQRRKLLRRCLRSFQFGSMSSSQFWLQFADQLHLEDPNSRLVDQLMRWKSQPSETLADTEGHLHEQSHGQQVIFVGQKHSGGASTVNKNFKYRKPANSGHQNGEGSKRNLLAKKLEWAAHSWLSKAGYPLVTATVYRDRVHLRQEPFSFAWWEELEEDFAAVSTSSDSPMDSHSAEVEVAKGETIFASKQVTSGEMQARHLLHKRHSEVSSLQAQEVTDLMGHNFSVTDSAELNGESSHIAAQSNQLELVEPPPVPTGWPIPLMFHSRFNPKHARLLWLLDNELEFPLNEDLAWPSTSDFSSTKSAGYRTAGSTSSYSSSPVGWLKLNVNQSSLVRVNYDERNWEALGNLLLKSHYSNHLLGALDRANLIDDALTLMRCGKVSVGIAMNLTLYLELGERDYAPWTSALRHLDQMQTLLNQNPLWHRYVLKLIQPIGSVIGWKDDGPHLMRKLRRSLFQVALRYGDEKIVAKAKQDFKSWIKSSRFIVPNLQELVYFAGVRYGDLQEWFHCWQKYQYLVQLSQAQNNGSASTSKAKPLRSRYETVDGIDLKVNQGGSSSSNLLNGIMMQSSHSPSSNLADSLADQPNAEDEKRQLLTALASTQNTWLLEQFLNNSMDPSKIQTNHMKLVIQTLGKNPVARLYLWRFVRLNWAYLLERYASTTESSEYASSDGDTYNQDDESKWISTFNSESSHHILETMVRESTKHFASKLDYDEVKSFFDSKRKQHPVWPECIELAIQRSLQIIRSNIYWREYIEPKLTKWLSNYDRMTIN